MQINARVVTGAVMALIAAATFTACSGGARTRSGDDDEAPIYVKNGSLDITSGDPASTDPKKHWQWSAPLGPFSSEWKHVPRETESESRNDDLYVKVYTTQPSTERCNTATPFSGKIVDINYSYDRNKTFSVKFLRKKSGDVSITRIQPHRGLSEYGDWTLRYGTPSTSDHIESLSVRGGGASAECRFEYEKDLEIRICAGAGTAECKADR